MKIPIVIALSLCALAPAWAGDDWGEGFRRRLTLRVLAGLAEPGVEARLERRLEARAERIPLAELAAGSEGLRAGLDDLDGELAARRGPASLVLQVVLPPGPGPVRLDQVLLAVRPGGPWPAWVEAYDRQGRVVHLDPDQPPPVPVLLPGVDLDGEGWVATVNGALAEAGLAPTAQTGPEPVPCGMLTFARLAPGQRAWWRQGLKAYLLLVGIDPAQLRPSLRVVDLPWLNRDGRDYFPNQLVLFWTHYRYQAVDLQLWKAGEDTSLKDLISGFLQAVSKAMGLAGALQYSWIPTLADALVRSVPASWWEDRDRCLDSFHTLEMSRDYPLLQGVSGNAWIGLRPFELRPR